jgi:ATP-dependent DNA helicase DinG
MIESIFGPNGLIAAAHNEYEYRPGQVQMAKAVLSAFENRKHLVVEAGTGTGKTLAYLVPAIAAASTNGTRVIISTGTKNLQEQLMEKDIPFLQRIIPRKFSASYMKGRSNYACLHRIKRSEDSPVLEGLDELDYFDEVRRWLRETETGDRAELLSLPENLPFWRHIDARSDTCLGQKCEEYDQCFITRMRKRALEADIIIVNHHLFFADLALRGNEYGQVLPDYSAVIFDEAHMIEEVASDYFGAQVSSYQIDDLLRDLQNLPITAVDINRELTRTAARVSRHAEKLWLTLLSARGEEARFPLLAGTFAKKQKNGEILTTAAGETYLSLDGALERLETTLDVVSDIGAEIESLIRRIRQIRFDLEFIVSGDDQKYVYWIERRGRGVWLRASPIDVSGILQDKLFDNLDTVVLTSATLTSGGDFKYIKERLGLVQSDELQAESSFDYEKHSLIYFPPKMPDPRSPGWSEAAASEIINLINATEGRAFVLSTSMSSMRMLYELVRNEVPYPCFIQGELSKGGLLNQFCSTPNSVLFATSSFWQGVDVRGSKLSCVIIEKLPFAVPSDPIVAARSSYIEAQGRSSFYDYSIPQAIISLKQGLGRLIRSSTDRGVLAVLDPRLHTQSYGKVFLKSLPASRRVQNIKEVARMFELERSFAP